MCVDVGADLCALLQFNVVSELGASRSVCSLILLRVDGDVEVCALLHSYALMEVQKCVLSYHLS